MRKKKASELNTEYDHTYVGGYQRIICFLGLVLRMFLLLLFLNELKLPSFYRVVTSACYKSKVIFLLLNSVSGNTLASLSSKTFTRIHLLKMPRAQSSELGPSVTVVFSDQIRNMHPKLPSSPISFPSFGFSYFLRGFVAPRSCEAVTRLTVTLSHARE